VVMTTAAQKPGTCDIDGETHTGDRDCLGEMNLDRGKQTGHRLVADQNRDYRENDGARETSEIAEFAGAERKVGILGMSARVRVRKRREEQRAGVGTHVQAVRDERYRSKEETADYFRTHHRATEPDHSPRIALTLIVPLAEEDMLMERRFRKRGFDCHGKSHFK
jgi:hypothetical protein